MVLCVIGLTGCSNRPASYCPYPPTMPEKEVGYILDNTDEKENVYLNKHKKYLCKYWRVYDKPEYIRNCTSN